MKKISKKENKKSIEKKSDFAIRHLGFLPEEITPDQWVLGANTKIAGLKLMPGGHGWKKFLPLEELQHRNNFESMNCSNYGTLNCWETLALLVFGIQFNWSERYTGVGSGTTKNGNYPHQVAEVIRNDIGLIDETILPFGPDINTWEKYYFPSPLPPALIAQGRLFLQKYKLGHDWVFVKGSLKEKQDKIKEALEYSPLGVSVLAWKERKGKMWKDVGENDNHWCMLYDFVEGKEWHIFDHYDDTHKILEWDYDFGYVKRYSIEVNREEPKNWLLEILKKIGAFIKGVLIARPASE